jgi:hypothetical protein
MGSAADKATGSNGAVHDATDDNAHDNRAQRWQGMKKNRQQRQQDHRVEWAR